MTTSAQTTSPRTAEILDIAEQLVQERGFNAFSYAHIADALGVTKPALHYHFASKGALGDALVARYSERFFRILVEIASSSSDLRTRLERYVGVYREQLAAERMCLCGMLASDYQTLPESMREAVAAFFVRNEAWLVRVLREGAADLASDQPVEDIAARIVDTLEGALMVSRARHDLARFDRVVDGMVAALLDDRKSSGRRGE